MEQGLKEAAQAGDIKALYVLIRKNPNILKNMDEIPFVDTPLHIAASLGHTHFVMEIVNLWPSFGKKLNPDGLSAVHLATLNGHTETAKRLISIDSEFIRVRGKDWTTPLHCAAEMGNVDLLAEFLEASPQSIEDLNIRCESVVHVVVRKTNFAALRVLFGWITRNRRLNVLNWKDEKGNTVLHIAASTNQHQVVRMLVYRMDKNDKNLEGLTALNVALGEETLGILRCARARKGVSVPNRKTRAEILSGMGILDKLRVFDVLSRMGILDRLRVVVYTQRGLSSETRNAVLVVAVLIATATYTAVLNPPGGLWQHDTTLNANTTTDSHSKTPPPRPTVEAAMKQPFLALFFSLNSLTFVLSISLILVVLPIGHYFPVLYVCLIFLLLTYTLSLMVITLTPKFVI